MLAHSECLMSAETPLFGYVVHDTEKNYYCRKLFGVVESVYSMTDYIIVMVQTNVFDYPPLLVCALW